MKKRKPTATILTPLQLERYELEELHVKANPDWRPRKDRAPKREVEIDFDFYASGTGSASPMYRFQVSVDINKNPAAFKAADYQCTVLIRSYFSYTPDTTEHETYDRVVLPNSLAMTYSIARGIIAGLTGNSRFGPLFLSTVNMHAVIERKLNAAAVGESEGKKGVKK